MFLRYSADHQTIDQIIETKNFTDINNWEELNQCYGFTRNKIYDFLYSKENYIKISKTLQFMMIEILFICLCDKVFHNTSQDHFECCIPFEQDITLKYFTTKRTNKVNFNNLSELIIHTKTLKCNHHRILEKYLNYYDIFKKEQSVLIQ